MLLFQRGRSIGLIWLDFVAYTRFRSTWRHVSRAKHGGVFQGRLLICNAEAYLCTLQIMPKWLLGLRTTLYFILQFCELAKIQPLVIT